MEEISANKSLPKNKYKHASQKAVPEKEALRTQEKTVQTLNKFCMRKWAQNPHTIHKQIMVRNAVFKQQGTKTKQITKNLLEGKYNLIL